MEVQNPSSGQTTVSWTSTHIVLQDRVRGGEHLGRGRLRLRDRHGVEEVQDHHRGPLHQRHARRRRAALAPGSVPRGRANGASGAPRTGAFAPGGGAGFERGGTGGSRPSFPGGGSGSSNFRRQLASLSVASGKVTAVHGSTVTVSGIKLSPGSFPGRGSTNSKSSSQRKKPVAPKKEKLTITTSSSTTVSATQSALSSDLAVGDCVSAFGPGGEQRRGDRHHGADHVDRRSHLHRRQRRLLRGRLPGGRGGFPGGGGFPGAPGGSRA